MFSSLTLFSRSKTRDSLLVVYRTSTIDSVKAEALGRLSWGMRFRELDSSFYYGDLFQKYAEKSKYTYGIILSHTQFGELYRLRSNFDSSLRQYELAEELINVFFQKK